MPFLLALLASAAPALTVDGAPAKVDVLATVSSGALVVRVVDFTIWLDDAQPRAFTTVQSEDGPVMLLQGKQLIAARVFTPREEGKRQLVNPLAGRDLSELRGVSVSAWNASVAKSFSGLTGERLCVDVHDDAVKAISALPTRLPCLWASVDAEADFSALARLKQLRVTELSSTDAVVRPSWLPRTLEVLSADSVEVQQLARLSRLPRLRELKVVGGRLSGELGAFPALEKLSVHSLADPLDLSHLVAPGLTELTLSTQVSALPASLPALQRLEALASGLDLTSFAKAHPGARMVTTWAGKLKARLERVDSIRVRSGGLCHTSPERETELARVTGPTDIAALLEALTIDEAKSNGVCMCCGAPTLEFYEGQVLVAAVGVQHGVALRWEGWPADGELRDERFVRLLATHGVKGPLEERQKEERRGAARAALKRRYEAALPPSVGQALGGGASTAELAELLEAAVPNPTSRAAVLLRLFGARRGPWNTRGGLDDQVEKRLVSLEPNVLAAALVGADEEVLRGAERFVFGGGRVELAREVTLAAAVPTLARRSVASPWRHNRWVTLGVLAQLQTTGATQVLREVLEGVETPVEPGDDNRDGDWVSFRADPLAHLLEAMLPPLDGGRQLEVALSERASAALLLAARKDVASREAVRALERTVGGLDLEAVTVAARLLWVEQR